MKVLTINAGSSSLKFTLFEILRGEMLAKGQVERIGLDNPHLVYKRHDGETWERTLEVKGYEDALKVICDQLLDPGHGVLSSLDEVEAIGHRVVHGGEKITRPVVVDEAVKKVITECFALAPLHNPPNLAAIEACERIFPEVPNVAVFDTAFHQSMPPEAYLYAIPRELYTKHRIRRYGFHGTSHNYVAESTARLLDRPFEEVKLITCHLGNGCSITAVDGGRVVDTTMGMTPLEGLVMGTRCGNIDPAVVLHLSDKLKMTPKEIDKMLNKQSGLLGVAGIGSSDMRDIIQAAADGNERAELALRMFTRQIVKYVGAYFALLKGADAVVFTGGIGEYSSPIRHRILDHLACMGCREDAAANEKFKGEAGVISSPDSSWKAVVMPTNEELMIGLQTLEVIRGLKK